MFGNSIKCTTYIKTCTGTLVEVFNICSKKNIFLNLKQIT